MVCVLNQYVLALILHFKSVKFYIASSLNFELLLQIVFDFGLEYADIMLAPSALEF
ncbi:hypothetical protein RhiirA4_482181 [Rhizophagus irregularis]|uniref:Uncharacterized protein n=1 Tax=Rhizophagus irregularis TaxID=588596 RepID=A0A2I1HKN1_9GLOM|nr:hypothetical protein RhiirA4_482181 [Rhizophagus irregularis]